MTALMHASNISVSLGGTDILRGIDIAIGAGELVGLVGPNGAGKTTLLRVLAGVERNHTGALRFGDQPMAELDARAAARAVAYLPQTGAVHWDLRVEDLVMLGRLPHINGWRGASADDHAAARRAMAATDVSHLAGRRIGRISGGERARVLLARALAVESEILLADEPVAGLDPAHRLDVLEVLARRTRDGAAVVIVLHDLSMALRFCSRLVLLGEGEKVADGNPNDVLSPENLSACYGIRVHRGEADGYPFVVPLENIRPGAEP